jgi:predicted short-subunit dehydrogenase-like oxidoreductase (DUF2520 family)
VNIALIGAGSAAISLGVRWRDAGHAIVALSGRDATRARAAEHLPGVAYMRAVEAAREADVIVLGVPDAAIGEVAERVAGARPAGAWLCHLSGATGLDVLGPPPRRLAVHPLQTFPRPDPDRVVGSTVAVTADDEEGSALGESLARDAGARPFRLRAEDRALYHAGAVFASNHLVATSAIAERLFAAAGVPDPRSAMAPLQRATLENVHAAGPGVALTGPAVRGDLPTITANLSAIADVAPDAVAVYVALCRVMADLGVEAGRLSPERRAEVHDTLAAWS